MSQQFSLKKMIAEKLRTGNLPPDLWFNYAELYAILNGDKFQQGKPLKKRTRRTREQMMFGKIYRAEEMERKKRALAQAEAAEKPKGDEK